MLAFMETQLFASADSIAKIRCCSESFRFCVECSRQLLADYWGCRRTGLGNLNAATVLVEEQPDTPIGKRLQMIHPDFYRKLLTDKNRIHPYFGGQQCHGIVLIKVIQSMIS